MSGKLIMKRKLDKHQTQSLSQPLVDADAEVSIPSGSASGSGYQKTTQNNDDESSNECRVLSSNPSTQQPRSKRLRCDTPPPEPEDEGRQHLQPLVAEVNQDNFVNNQRNRHLLEAIQSKMLELQQELDEFEQDFETYEDDFDNSPSPAQQHVMSEQEAEALGYAMCAQETILFLQSEGVPSDSLLYTRIRDALVGRGDNDHVFKI